MSVTVVVLMVLVVLLVMAGEARVSARNEVLLRAKGATEPGGDVYRTMRWAYPASFVAMGLEGLITGPPRAGFFAAGVIVFVLSKVLKLWAIRTLGERWTFRVLVLAGAPLIVRGPYQFMRHPNYAAVVGELIGAALALEAPLAGIAALVGFGALLRRRIGVEDRALGRK